MLLFFGYNILGKCGCSVCDILTTDYIHFDNTTQTAIMSSKVSCGSSEFERQSPFGSLHQISARAALAQAPARALIENSSYLPSQTAIATMKPHSVLRALSRPTALAKPYHRPTIIQIAPLSARKFSGTPRRQFLDVCLAQTHTFICGIHDMTGLPWAATIPLVAFLVRFIILQPLHAYSIRRYEKTLTLLPQLKESIITIVEKTKEEHRDKSSLERQNIRNRAVKLMWRQILKQNRAQRWRSYLHFIKVPIWFTMMETLRRMTGTEDGMVSLTAKSLQGKANLGPGTMVELIPVEPSLATEGMLWFDDLMIPDSWLVLPFALSAITFVIYRFHIGTLGLARPLSSPESARKLHSL